MTDRPASGYDLDGAGASATAAQAEYAARSEEAAKLPGARLDLAYGTHPRQRLDVFSAGPGAPVLVFFHGGYWKAGSKDSRRFPAIPWRARGVTWVAVNYRLVPGHDLEDAVTDARNALIWLSENAARLGIDPAALHVCGNSAGGHLAAMVAARNWPGRPPIRSLCAVSALCDLAPLLAARTNAWLRLDPPRARALSPVHSLPPADLPVIVAVGGAETAEFRAQSSGYADLLRGQGTPVTWLEPAGQDHFRIIGGFGDPACELFAALARQIGPGSA